jgi:serine/threonine-protein kinase
MVGQIASALDYAHGRGLVHRDIKPSNIMVEADDHVTVMDFGIAKAATLTALTTTGRIFGTPEYMSPEQAEGEEEPDARSDIYSLGVVVYEMFTGKVPFSGTTPLSIMRGHADKPPPLPSKINPDVSPAVEAVLLRALAKKREERYQSAGEMAVALQQAVSRAVIEAERVPAPSPVVPAPAPPPARPALPWKWVAGIGAVVVVIVGLIIALVTGGKPEPKPTSTPTAAALAPTDTPLPLTPTSTPTPTLLPPTDTPTPVPPTDTPLPSAPSSDMVHVPAGEFTMGSDEGGSDERPVHTVYLDAFYIDKTEVTNAQFAAFVSATGYETDAEQIGCGWILDGDYWGCIQEVDWQHPFGPDTDLAGKDEHPVVQVSWNDAKAYCKWAGARLPTEAEWEKGARGTDGLMYPWGNTFDGTKLNFADKNTNLDWSDSNWDDGYADTAPVGSYPDGASPYGALDMAGNVWEWVADWYDSGYYAASPESNPRGPASGDYRVIRGGSWSDDVALVRAACRYGDPPDDSASYVGFRCAR